MIYITSAARSSDTCRQVKRRVDQVRKALAVFFLAVLFSFKAAPPPAGATESTIPFERLSHLMVTSLSINGSDEEYRFVIDTGGLTFVDKGLADELGLKQMGMQAKIDSLDLSGFVIHKVFCFTSFDFSHFDALGSPIHGIIGSNLMERYRTTVDFRAGSLTLSGDSTALEGPSGSVLLSFRNHPVNNAPIVHFQLRGDSLEGMIDTGQPYPLVFPLEDFDKYESLYVYDSVKSRGLIEEWPMTRADHNYLARVGPLELGSARFDSAVALFGELPPLLSMPLIGNDLLSEFKLVIDYPRDEMLLIPYEDIGLEANHFSAGIRPGISDDGEVIVKGIWEGSAADLAGIGIGDRVLAFDGVELTPQNLIDLIGLLEDAAVKGVTLKISRGGAVREVRLDKAPLFKPFAR